MNKIFRLRISDSRFDNLKSKIENGWMKGEEEKAK
jgi:hypothetical protein